MSLWTPSNPKAAIYVGGFGDEVGKEILHAAFIPFGDIVHIEIPRSTNRRNVHKGIAFIEFEEAEDASSAIDNMHHSEIYGKLIRVTMAKATKMIDGSIRPVWEDEDYIQEHIVKKEEVEKEVNQGEEPSEDKINRI